MTPYPFFEDEYENPFEEDHPDPDLADDEVEEEVSHERAEQPGEAELVDEWEDEEWEDEDEEWEDDEVDWDGEAEYEEEPDAEWDEPDEELDEDWGEGGLVRETYGYDERDFGLEDTERFDHWYDDCDDPWTAWEDDVGDRLDEEEE